MYVGVPKVQEDGARVADEVVVAEALVIVSETLRAVVVRNVNPPDELPDELPAGLAAALLEA